MKKNLLHLTLSLTVLSALVFGGSANASKKTTTTDTGTISTNSLNNWGVE